MTNKTNYKKVIQTYRIPIDSIILLEKIANAENRSSITNAVETCIYEKAEKLGFSVSDEEIEKKVLEFKEKKRNKNN